MVRWTLAEPERLGTAWGVRAASMAGVNSEIRTRLHEHARITMVSTMPRWPPVGGHPAIVVAIKMQLGRAQERSAWEDGWC